jgi:hypothetical protein
MNGKLFYGSMIIVELFGLILTLITNNPFISLLVSVSVIFVTMIVMGIYKI